jgi:hypothetical protein
LKEFLDGKHEKCRLLATRTIKRSLSDHDRRIELCR